MSLKKFYNKYIRGPGYAGSLDEFVKMIEAEGSTRVYATPSTDMKESFMVYMSEGSETGLESAYIQQFDPTLDAAHSDDGYVRMMLTADETLNYIKSKTSVNVSINTPGWHDQNEVIGEAKLKELKPLKVKEYK